MIASVEENSPSPAYPEALIASKSIGERTNWMEWTVAVPPDFETPAYDSPRCAAGEETAGSMPPVSPAVSLPDWIPARIKNRITVEDHGDERGPCWIVNGWSNGAGHAKARWRGVCTFTHRIVLALSLWVHPEELDVVDHLCRKRRCCNPDHLENVTMGENTERGLGVLHQFRRAA